MSKLVVCAIPTTELVRTNFGNRVTRLGKELADTKKKLDGLQKDDSALYNPYKNGEILNLTGKCERLEAELSKAEIAHKILLDHEAPRITVRIEVEDNELA